MLLNILAQTLDNSNVLFALAIGALSFFALWLCEQQEIEMVTVRIDEKKSVFRIAGFYIGLEDYSIIKVSQCISYATLKWKAPEISSSTGNYDNSEMARLHAQAMLQAADLMDEWGKDTGKEIE